jgi:hypothetical protein
VALLTLQHTGSGLNPTYVAAAAAGDSYVNQGAQTLLVRNQGPVPITVTIAAQTVCSAGGLHPISFIVPAGGLAPVLLGPYSQFFYNDASGNLIFTYSSTAQPAPGAMAAALLTSLGLGVGTYRYQVTFVNGSGETTGGTEITVVTTAGNQAVSLAGIPLGPGGTTARKLYRTIAGGASGAEKLLATISDNTTTTYQDTLPDSALGATVPGSNTAGVPAPGAASAAAGAAGSPNGAYRYQVTFVNAVGRDHRRGRIHVHRQQYPRDAVERAAGAERDHLTEDLSDRRRRRERDRKARRHDRRQHHHDVRRQHCRRLAGRCDPDDEHRQRGPGRRHGAVIGATCPPRELSSPPRSTA